MHRLITIVAFVALLITLPRVAEAGKRVALIIGNGNYTSGPLANPTNDAKLMAYTLRSVGFEVSIEIDATLRGMKKAIINFGKRIQQSGKDTVGLVFYAGHGVQASGKNYLIPVNAHLEDESDLDLEAVDADWILNKMEFAQNDLNFVILDACRDNPFARSFRSSTRGLARMSAPRGTLIAYATSPGSVAADGDGTNSPYTLALSNSMTIPGLSASDMFIQTRNQVMEATNYQQVPWEEGGLTAQFYFAGQPEQLALTPEIVFWQSIQDSAETSMYEAYLDQYPNGAFAIIAKGKIASIAASKVDVPVDSENVVLEQTQDEETSNTVIDVEKWALEMSRKADAKAIHPLVSLDVECPDDGFLHIVKSPLVDGYIESDWYKLAVEIENSAKFSVRGKIEFDNGYVGHAVFNGSVVNGILDGAGGWNPTERCELTGSIVNLQ